MKIHANVLIIGAGYSGLILQHELKKLGHKQSIIIDKGATHGYTGDDYVIFLKREFDFTDGTIDVKVVKNSSGSSPFSNEYTQKVYNKRSEVSLFSGDEPEEKTIGYPISSEILLDGRNIYGNIAVTGIDLDKKIVYGKVLHIDEDVQISYETLVNTMPIHRFAKYAKIDLFHFIGLFISYFPIGIKRVPAIQPADEMLIQYESDPNIPYYRKQHHGKSIYYEYCLNKPFKEKFTSVIVPGKFSKQPKRTLELAYEFFEKRNVFMLGRYACWDPDFLLDHVSIDETLPADPPPFRMHIHNLYTEITK